MKAPQTRRAPIQEIRRAELIEGARLCIAERGLQATTLQDIASYAQTTASSAIYHFGSKEELISATVAATADEVREQAEHAIAAVDGVIAKIAAIATTALNPSDTSTISWRLWLEFRSQAMHDTFVRGIYMKKYEQWVDMIGQVISDGIGSRELSKCDIRETARMISAIIDGTAFELIINRSPNWKRARDLCLTALGRFLALG